MPVLQEVKRVVENVTGFARPDRDSLSRLVRVREPTAFRFSDDGKTPNNPKWPLLIYRSPVKLRSDFDPAAIFEDLFDANGWTDSWRDGIYEFLHFHTHRHEVLGIARGSARVAFGGENGRQVRLKAGDVAVLPAGTGHRRTDSSHDLLVVGAYPEHSGKYDQPKPGDLDHGIAVSNIRKVPRPRTDPVYGSRGPLHTLWPEGGSG